jgi:hypothetical protein
VIIIPLLLRSFLPHQKIYIPAISVVDPHHFGNLDPHPHQIKIRIRFRTKIYNVDPEPDPDPHQFADVKPKCME